MQIALKVDVDTYEGMKIGVPNLLKLFQELGIKASFFVPFGPDESGKAIFRVFTKRGFLQKMFRSNALKLYGLKTALRGTLLPAPKIGASFPEIARSIVDHGHELGIHGYNHVLWQDHLLGMAESKVKEQFDLGMAAFEKALAKKPQSFAAPAWLCSSASLKWIDELRFSYASDTRGLRPFFPRMNGTDFKTLQIPSTLPTSDELLGVDGLDASGLHDFLTKKMQASNLDVQVHTIHTETEGAALLEPFSNWIFNLKQSNFNFIRLADWADTLLKNPQSIPRNEIRLQELPGRAGKVACQIPPPY